MIQIIKFSTNEAFDLFDKFRANLQLNSPVLSSKGEQTLPGTIPATAKNLRMIEYSNRIDNHYKPIEEFEVTLIDGLYIKKCNMVINSIDEDSGIGFTIYLDTGSFMSKVNETKLNRLDWEIIGNGNILDFKSQVLDPVINSINNSETRFCCVPVLTSHDYTLMTGEYGLTKIEGLYVLNGLERYKNNSELAISNNSINYMNFDYVLEGENEQDHLENGVPVRVSLGYGISPFMRLRYCLEKMFELLGYSFSYNDITSYNANFEKIILINNVLDSIYARRLRFANLVPEITIKEFIAEIEKFFAGIFIVNELKKEVKFHYYKDILNSDADMDLSEYIVNYKPKLGATEFKKLIFNINNSYQESEDESKEKLEIIAFDILNNQTVETKFEYTVSTFTPTMPPTTSTYSNWYLYRMNFHDIGNTTHRNSSVVINNGDKQPTIEKPESLKKVLMLSYDKNKNFRADNVDENFKTQWIDEMTQTQWEQFKITKGINFQYHSTDRIFEGVHNNDLETFQDLYLEYGQFIEHSNIPVVCSMRIPKHLLNSIKLHLPKLINGQKVLIEQIKTIIGEDNPIQEVTFRTIRPFANRQ